MRRRTSESRFLPKSALVDERGCRRDIRSTAGSNFRPSRIDTAEETVFLRSVRGVRVPQFHPRPSGCGLRSGPDVFADALVPTRRGSPRLFYCPDIVDHGPDPRRRRSCAPFQQPAPRHPSSVAAAHSGKAPCGNGYRCPKRHGKPNFAIARKCLRHSHFFDSCDGRPPCAFTARSSRYLNCPSNLLVHIRLNKPANGSA